MKRPIFKKKYVYAIYEIAKRFYFLLLIAYVPLLFVGTLIGRLRSPGGFMDFGYGFDLFLLFLVTAPLVLIFAALGFVISRILYRQTKENTPADYHVEVFSKKLSKAKNIMTAVIVTVSVLAILFVPYATIHYDDGGTVKTSALAYTIMDWNRTKDWYGDPIPEEPQERCVYFFPQNLLSYEELWELKH